MGNVNYNEWLNGKRCCGQNNIISIARNCHHNHACDCDNILLDISKLYTNDEILQDEIDAISGNSGITSGEVQTMIDESISGKVDTTTFDAYTAYTVNELNGKASKSFVTSIERGINENLGNIYGELLRYENETDAALSGKASTSSVNALEMNVALFEARTDGQIAGISGAVNTALSGKADTSAVTQSINAATSGKADSSAVTQEISAAVSGKQDTLIAGDNITISGNVISATGGSGTTYTAGRGININSGNTISFSLPISAGTGLNSLVIAANSPQNRATGKGAVALNGYFTTTVAKGNNSLAQGDGAVANGQYSHAEGYGTSAMTDGSHSEGNYTKAIGQFSHAEGIETIANGDASHTEGFHTITKQPLEYAGGMFNISNSATTTFGDSGNTLFSVGNGSAEHIRHNAVEVRQNGSVYIADTSASGSSATYPMINLQDALNSKADSSAVTQEISAAVSGKQDTLSAGTGIEISGNVISATGGSSITIDPSLDSGSTNPVSNSAITATFNNYYTKTEINNRFWCGDSTAWAAISGTASPDIIYFIY